MTAPFVSRRSACYAERMPPTSDQQALHAAFQRRAAVLRELGAQHLVDNLQPGAKPLALSRLEQKLGFPLPKALRTLWLLHDGEKKPAEGFAAPFHLLPIAWVLNARVVVQRRLERLRQRPETWAASGTSEPERADDRWVPFASMEGVTLVVHAPSGRVFECSDEDPALRPLEVSVVQWLASVAQQQPEPDDD